MNAIPISPISPTSASLSSTHAQPRHTLESLYAHALSLQRENKMVEASQSYLALLQHAPQHWPSFYNLGLVFQSLNRLPDALIAYQRVVAIKPDFAQAFNNMGIVLQALKRDHEAIDAYQRAITLDPSLAQARYNMALIQQARGQMTASTESLSAAVAANPKDDQAWDALYRALLGLRRQEEAIQTFLAWEAAIGRSPSLTAAGLAMSRYLGDVSKAHDYVKLAIDWPFDIAAPEALAPILGMLQYFDIDGKDLFKCYRRYDEATLKASPTSVPTLPRRAKGERLRIGYVSGDFRRHVMGRIMLDVISAHDKDKFSVHLISLCEPQHHDKTTAAFRAVVDTFTDVSALNDLNAAKVIAEADLDVLIDLAGHTMAARPGIYALRPASKIVTHLGYHGCLGMSAVDYKLTDAIADDESSTAVQIEKPFYLDGCLFPFTHVESTAEDNAKYRRQPVSHDTPGHDQEFVFATFVNVLKMSPRCLAAWRQIMDAVPKAVLAFSPVYANDEVSIRRVVASVGIDEARLRFIPAGSSDGEQRARYQLVDAVLDTFPYAGGDTTLAALDRDVPVITLRGNGKSNGNGGGRNAERVGVSILTHLGITDTIGEDEQEYVACAIRVAQDEELHSSLRSRIAHARRHSAMGNVANHTKSLERAYVQIATEGIQRTPSALTAEQFFQRFNAALKNHEAARDEKSKKAVAEEYADLAVEQPAYLPLLKISAILAESRGLIDEAMHFLQQALLIAPDDAESAIALAAMQSDAHANDVALTTIDAALQTSSDNSPLLASLHTSQARILLRLDRAEAALNAADKATSISPADIAANLIRANSLAELGEAALALQAYGRVLSQVPAHIDAAYNAALISLDIGDAATAETLFRRVINTDPTHELAHIKLAQSLKAQQKTDAWVSLAKRVAAEFPNSARGKLLRAEARRFEQDLAAESREISLLAKALCVEPDHFLVEELAQPILQRVAAINLPENLTESLAARYLSALNAIYRHDVQATERAAQHAAQHVAQHAAQHAAQHEAQRAKNAAAKSAHNVDGAIKIGFLVENAHLHNARQQQVNEFARSFENNNSTLVLYVLANDVEFGANATNANQSTLDTKHLPDHRHQGWTVVSLAGLGAVRAAKRIREDSPDVLIDLVGYRHALAPPIMFQQPARMQLVNGAFANVFDCEAIDFEIFDPWTALPKWKANGPTRAVMRLQSVTSDVSPVAARIGSEAAISASTAPPVFLFAIGAVPSEISLESARLWKSILDQVPNAMIAVPALNDADLRSYHDVLRAGGIGSTRITQLSGMNTINRPGRSSRSSRSSRFMTANAVLDTVGVSDAIVATEALAAGVAMIALRGPTAKERMAYSVLARGGFIELVADSGPDYIALAAKYARDAAFRADFQIRLTVNLANDATDGATSAQLENQTSTNYQALVFALKEISKNA